VAAEANKRPTAVKLERRDRIAIIQALSAGAVPPSGLRFLQVGLERELDTVAKNLAEAAEGMASVRFVAGPPESGKTFFLHLVRALALERGFVVAQADLSAARRLHARNGEARALYSELMKNLVAPPGPDTIALGTLIQRWVAGLEADVHGRGGGAADVEAAMAGALQPLLGLSGGFDFATVLGHYYEGCVTHNTELQGNALRWLRAEYTSAEEARADLGVRSIIDDDSLLNSLALFAAFLKITGCAGLLVNLDELGALVAHLRDPAARAANFAVIRQLMDMCLQGRVSGLMLLFAVDDAGLEDRQRGLKSDETLGKRLAPSRFANNGFLDLSSPVIRLRGVAREDYPRLLANVQEVFSEDGRVRLPAEGIERYLEACDEQYGPEYVQQPCETVRDFLGLLRVLENDRSADWSSLLEAARVESSRREEADALWRRRTDGFGWGAGAGSFGDLRGRRWSRRGVAAAIAVALLAAAIVLGVWAVVVTAMPALKGQLQVKYSEIRGGLRLPVTGDVVPLTVGSFFSVDVSLSEPAYAWVVGVDQAGVVSLLYGEAEQPAKTTRVQLPGGNELWPVTAPPGTKTIILLASRTAVKDTEELRRAVRALRPLPQAASADLLVLRRGEVTRERSRQAGVGGAAQRQESDVGFLTQLQNLFGGRFEVVQAVAFPIVAEPVESSPLLYDQSGS